MKKLITLLTLMCAAATSYGINYYYVGSGSLTATVNWGIATDGSGTNPTNFTTASNVFYITNTASVTLDAPWTVSGGSSKIVVGNGSTVEFVIPSAFAVAGTVDVSASCTLTLQNATSPTMGTLNATSTVVYDGAGAQTIVAGTYNGMLLVQNDRGTANLTFTGAINIPGTFSLTATNVGSYVTTGSTINYNKAGGGQSIYSVIPYNNLSCGSGAGTTSVDGNLSIAGTLTMPASAILDMGTFDILTITTFTLNNSSTIRTQSTSGTPIPSGKVIGGTVNYNAAGGGQSVIPETSYRNLTIGNTGGTNTATGNLVVSTLITTVSGGTLDMGTFKVTGAASVTNGGTIKTQYAGSDPFTTGKTYTGGTVEYNGRYLYRYTCSVGRPRYC